MMHLKEDLQSKSVTSRGNWDRKYGSDLFVIGVKCQFSFMPAN